jgi:thiamine pyrophosphokinase
MLSSKNFNHMTSKFVLISLLFSTSLSHTSSLNVLATISKSTSTSKTTSTTLTANCYHRRSINSRNRLSDHNIGWGGDKIKARNAKAQALYVHSLERTSIETMGNQISNTIDEHDKIQQQQQQHQQEKQQKEVVHSVKSPFLASSSSSSSFRNKEEEETKYKNVLIILNSPIHSLPQSSSSSTSANKHNINPIFEKLWNISSYRVCADGGANRLYDATVTTDTNIDTGTTARTNKYIPNLIKGDLDSVKPNVLNYYQTYNDNEGESNSSNNNDDDNNDVNKTDKTDHKCHIIKDFDQDTNDLDKALSSVCQWWDDEKQKQNEEDDGKDVKIQVYIYGAFGGRFDQEMASIQALYKWSNVFDYRVFLYNHETCSWLLKPTTMNSDHDDMPSSSSPSLSSCVVRNEIQIPFYGEDEEEDDDYQNCNTKDSTSSMIIGEGPTCGLIPIGCKCNTVKTEGLKWNLDGSSSSTLEFGGLVSSSNRAIDDVVAVYASDPLVFTAEIITKYK